MKVDIKKDWKFYAVVTCVVILIGLITTYTAKINDKFYSKAEVQEATGIVENVSYDTKIEQTFIALDNNLNKVNIDFESYKDKVGYGGDIIIGIKDDQNNIIGENKISRNYVREISNYTLNFKCQKESQYKEYKIYINFEDLGKYKEFYTVKITDKNEFENNKLYINGEEKENSSIIFQDCYRSNKRICIYCVTLGVMIIGVYIISSIIYYKKDIKMENVFLMIAPFVCIFFLITMPLFKSHDEYYHWLKADEVSTGNLMTPIEDGRQGSLVSDGVTEALPKDWTKITYKDLVEKSKLNLNKDKKGIINPETAAVYSFVQYIPQAVGIFIARCITSNVYAIAYAGRLFNIIVSILLLYFAIKIIPFGKKLILVPALIPIAIEGFTSLSPDAMTISMSFLYIAYILYLAFNKDVKVNLKEHILLIIMSSIIALCKIVYIPLVGLILIIPKEKFKKESNKYKILSFILIAGIAVALNLGWLALSSRYLSNFREGDSKIQVISIFKNPLLYIQNLLYTIDLKGDNYLLTLFGRQLGWGEFVKLNSLVPYSLIGIYLFAVITDDEIKEKLKTYQIIWILLVVLAIIGLVFTSLYVQWTPVGKNLIEGVQGRYFLPILPLIMLLIGNKIKLKSEYNKESVNKFIAISLLVLQIYTIAQILIVHL